MPELPEVETIKRGLEKRVVGLEIAKVDVRVEKLFIGKSADIVGATILSIWRKAKVLGMDLSNGKTMLVHLKMTGQLVYQDASEEVKVVGGHPQKSYNDPLPHKHTHIIIHFSNGSRLYFNDMRKFGWFRIVGSEEVGSVEILKSTGVEPFDEGQREYEQHKAELKQKFLNSGRAIKLLLLDQTIIGGLGNIYADEILYGAGIMPNRAGRDLNPEEVDKILHVVPKVLEKAVVCGGTSDSTYRDVEGERGTYLDCASVYHKKVDPKGHEIKKMKLGGRTSHYCPICQK